MRAKVQEAKQQNATGSGDIRNAFPKVVDVDCDEALVTLIAVNNLSFSSTESFAFRNFIAKASKGRY